MNEESREGLALFDPDFFPKEPDELQSIMTFLRSQKWE